MEHRLARLSERLQQAVALCGLVLSSCGIAENDEFVDQVVVLGAMCVVYERDVKLPILALRESDDSYAICATNCILVAVDSLSRMGYVCSEWNKTIVKFKSYKVSEAEGALFCSSADMTRESFLEALREPTCYIVIKDTLRIDQHLIRL